MKERGGEGNAWKILKIRVNDPKVIYIIELSKRIQIILGYHLINIDCLQSDKNWRQDYFGLYPI